MVASKKDNDLSYIISRLSPGIKDIEPLSDASKQNIRNALQRNDDDLSQLDPALFIAAIAEFGTPSETSDLSSLIKRMDGYSPDPDISRVSPDELSVLRETLTNQARHIFGKAVGATAPALDTVTPPVIGGVTDTSGTIEITAKYPDSVLEGRKPTIIELPEREGDNDFSYLLEDDKPSVKAPVVDSVNPVFPAPPVEQPEAVVFDVSPVSTVRLNFNASDYLDGLLMDKVDAGFSDNIFAGMSRLVGFDPEKDISRASTHWANPFRLDMDTRRELGTIGKTGMGSGGPKDNSSPAQAEYFADKMIALDQGQGVTLEQALGAAVAQAMSVRDMELQAPFRESFREYPGLKEFYYDFSDPAQIQDYAQKYAEHYGIDANTPLDAGNPEHMKVLVAAGAAYANGVSKITDMSGTFAKVIDKTIDEMHAEGKLGNELTADDGNFSMATFQDPQDVSQYRSATPLPRDKPVSVTYSPEERAQRVADIGGGVSFTYADGKNYVSVNGQPVSGAGGKFADAVAGRIDLDPKLDLKPSVSLAQDITFKV